MSSLQGSRHLKMGLIAYLETSVNNYHPSLCNIPEEYRPYIYLDTEKSTWINMFTGWESGQQQNYLIHFNNCK